MTRHSYTTAWGTTRNHCQLLVVTCATDATGALPDPTEKLDAMEAIVPPHLRRGAFQPSDKLIALLKRAS